MPEVLVNMTIPSPFGPLTLVEENGAIVALRWGGDASDTSPLLIKAARQIDAYFCGKLRRFDLPLAPQVSAFQAKFSDILTAIPYGETRTYGEVIGQACGANPIPILIPCHRVLAATGLGGFSAPGGIESKVALLKHEGAAGLLL
jgi:methylated-DNA-[protein]-cysteine S-methyltransferase